MSGRTCGHPTWNSRPCQGVPSHGEKYCKYHRLEKPKKVQWNDSTPSSPPQSSKHPITPITPTKAPAWSVQKPLVASNPGRALQPVHEFLNGIYCQCLEPQAGQGEKNDTCQRSKSEPVACCGCGANTLLLNVTNISKRFCIPILVRKSALKSFPAAPQSGSLNLII